MAGDLSLSLASYASSVVFSGHGLHSDVQSLGK